MIGEGGWLHAFFILALPLAAGFLLDLIVGDPYCLPHPIRLIGKAIEKGEAFVRRLFPATQAGERIGGTVLTLVIMLLSFSVPFFILLAAWKIHLALYLVLATIMCYQILAVKALRTESMKVYDALEPISSGAYDRKEHCDLEKARYQVSMIVGRDTQNLTAEQVAKAAVETVAENTSDGTIAPMLFMLIGGAPLGFLYKGINTMDSMIGYKNDRYLYFGRTAAKLDDLVNFLPARVAAMLMILASCLLGMDGHEAMRIFRRDRFNHASPNSAQTESVCAGALHIQLAGDAYYFGKLYPKQTIGDSLRPVEREDIARANRLLYATAWLCLIICIAIMGIGAFVWLS